MQPQESPCIIGFPAVFFVGTQKVSISGTVPMRKPYWRAEQRPGSSSCPMASSRRWAPTRTAQPGSIRPGRSWRHGTHRARQPEPKDMTISQVAEKYLAYLENPKTRASAKEHLDAFVASVGKGMKVSDLRVHHVNDHLKAKGWGEFDQGHRRQPDHLGVESRRGGRAAQGAQGQVRAGQAPEIRQAGEDSTEAQQATLEAASTRRPGGSSPRCGNRGAGPSNSARSPSTRWT